MKQDIARLSSMFGNAARICIVNHTHPDGDAMGCATALAGYLSAVRGKDVTVVVPDPWPVNLDFLATGLKILVASEDGAAAEAALNACDLLVGVDFNTFSRTGGLESALRELNVPKVLVDHHLNPDTDTFSPCISETEISSASELLFQVLMEMPDICGDASKLPASCGISLMTGMTTDTNNFANSVFPSTFRMASALLEAGVDRDSILQHIYNEERENRLRAMGIVLKDKLKVLDNGVAYFIMDRETQEALDLRDGEMEGFVNLPLALADVRLSISAKETDGQYRISIRSKKGTSANRLAMTYFNGGGHEQASGGKLRFPEDIQDRSGAGKYIEEVSARFMRDEGLGN